VPESELEEEMLGDIPEDPDEAMAWLEQLAARQGASLDELPSVKEVAEDVETPEWLAREAARDAQEEAAQAEASTGVEEPVAAEEEAPEAGTEELPELDWLDEIVEEEDADLPAEEPAMAEPAPVEEPVAEEEDLADLDLDMPESELEDSLPDWLPLDDFDEMDEAGWEDAGAEVDVAGWLSAEDEVTRQFPEPGELQQPEPAPEPPPSAEPMPESAAESVPPTFAPVPESLDLDREQLAVAREAIEGEEYETAAEVYQSLLDTEQGLSLLIADLEVAVDKAGHQPLLGRLLGDAYMQNGQLQKAVESYRRALEKL
jgi:tetratricopeptide (TPR) repeat protein